jgi:hypothetical protein
VTHDWPRVTHDWPRVTHDWPRVTHDWPRVTHDWPRVTHDWRPRAGAARVAALQRGAALLRRVATRSDSTEGSKRRAAPRRRSEARCAAAVFGTADGRYPPTGRCSAGRVGNSRRAGSADSRQLSPGRGGNSRRAGAATLAGPGRQLSPGRGGNSRRVAEYLPHAETYAMLRVRAGYSPLPALPMIRNYVSLSLGPTQCSGCAPGTRHCRAARRALQRGQHLPRCARRRGIHPAALGGAAFIPRRRGGAKFTPRRRGGREVGPGPSSRYVTSLFRPSCVARPRALIRVISL